MNEAEKIVVKLLETDEVDPKAMAMSFESIPRIRTSFSRVRWHGEGEDDYDEENGWEDEEGVEFEVDEFDDEGVDEADKAIQWLNNKGYLEPSSSHFHPGIWYSTYNESYDGDGWNTTYAYHLDGFTPEQEQKIFSAITKR